MHPHGRRQRFSQPQLMGLLALSGLPPNDWSPLRELVFQSGQPSFSAHDMRFLQEQGWLTADRSPQLTGTARTVLHALLQPTLRVSLLLGTRTTIGTTHAYSATGFLDDALVGYAAQLERQEFQVVFPQSPGDFADVLSDQVALGPVDQAVNFRTILTPEEYVTLTAVFDVRQQALLQAVLRRESIASTTITLTQVQDMLDKGRRVADFGWCVTLFSYLFPFFDYALNDEALAGALQTLAGKRLLTVATPGGYEMTNALLALSDTLLPVVAFAATHVAEKAPSHQEHGAHLVFLRGPSAIVSMQPVATADNERVVAIDCLNAVELGMMLWNLGLPNRNLLSSPEASSPPEEERACATCKAKLRTTQKFCPACGTPAPKGARPQSSDVVLAATSCSQCRLVLKRGARFCNHCGAAVTRIK